jgi:hypothetical protein
VPGLHTPPLHKHPLDTSEQSAAGWGAETSRPCQVYGCNSHGSCARGSFCSKVRPPEQFSALDKPRSASG